jgi:hypothetical protein
MHNIIRPYRFFADRFGRTHVLDQSYEKDAQVERAATAALKKMLAEHDYDSLLTGDERDRLDNFILTKFTVTLDDIKKTTLARRSDYKLTETPEVPAEEVIAIAKSVGEDVDSEFSDEQLKLASRRGIDGLMEREAYLNKRLKNINKALAAYKKNFFQDSARLINELRFAASLQECTHFDRVAIKEFEIAKRKYDMDLVFITVRKQVEAEIAVCRGRMFSLMDAMAVLTQSATPYSVIDRLNKRAICMSTRAVNYVAAQNRTFEALFNQKDISTGEEVDGERMRFEAEFLARARFPTDAEIREELGQDDESVSASRPSESGTEDYSVPLAEPQGLRAFLARKLPGITDKLGDIVHKIGQACLDSFRFVFTKVLSLALEFPIVVQLVSHVFLFFFWGSFSRWLPHSRRGLGLQLSGILMQWLVAETFNAIRYRKRKRELAAAMLVDAHNRAAIVNDLQARLNQSMQEHLTATAQAADAAFTVASERVLDRLREELAVAKEDAALYINQKTGQSIAEAEDRIAAAKAKVEEQCQIASRLWLSSVVDGSAAEMEELLDRFTDLSAPVAEPQSLGKTVLGLVAGATIARKVPLYRRIVDAKKFDEGLHAVATGSVEALESLVNMVLGALGRNKVRFIKCYIKEVANWSANVDAFCNALSTGARDPSNPESMECYERFRDQGLLYQVEFAHTDDIRHVKKGMDCLRRVAPFFPATGACKGRMEPLVIALSGAAGVGKTLLARIITAQFAQHCCSADELASVNGELAKLVFQKDSSDYWEGYNGQPVCVMDDFLQGIPVAGGDNEILGFIRAANQWPYPLNMATLDLKGKFYFKSRLIFITTNARNLSSLANVVSTPQAVGRRMDMCYTVEVDDAFLEGGKLRSDFLTLLPPNPRIADLDAVWRFKKHDLCAGRSDFGGEPLSELVATMRQRFEHRVQVEAANTNLLASLAQPQSFRNSAVAAAVVGASAVLVGRAARSVAQAASSVRWQFGRSADVASQAIEDLSVAASSVARNLSSTAHHVSDATTFLSGATFKVCASVAAIGGVGVLLSGVCTLARVFKTALAVVFGALGFRKSKKEQFAMIQGAPASKEEPPDDDIVVRVRKNVKLVYAEDSRGHLARVGHTLMATCRHAIVPYHYLREHRGKHFYVCDAMGRKLASLDTMTPIKNATKDRVPRDMCVLCADKQVDGVADIRLHFPPVAGSAPATNGARFVNVFESLGTRVSAMRQPVTYLTMEDLRTTSVPHSLRTKIGQCGSALVSDNKKMRGRVLGIHVAALDSGLFCPVFREDFSMIAEAQSFLGFEEAYDVEPLHNAGKTAILPTSYASWFSPSTGAPACLRPKEVDGVLVDPMEKAVRATCRDFSSVKLPDDFGLCVDAVVGEVFSTFGGEDLSQLTFEEAVAGVQGEQYIRGIPRGKSMGMPLCREYHNKRAAFGDEGPYTFEGEAYTKVREQYDSLIRHYKTGAGDPAIFRDVLKDEVRSLAKVAACDTRLISASPVQYTILTRQMFGRFCSAFMKHRLKHGGLVGVNPYSPEWGHIYGKLKSMNVEGVGASGDYGQFDKSQHALIIRSIMENIARRLPPMDKDVLEGIIRDTCNSVHIGGNSYKSGTVYKTNGSLPSGHPMTSVLNSLYNMVVFRMAWVFKRGSGKVFDFRKHVCLYVYGDDNIFAPDSDNQWFDLTYMSEFAPTVGMVYTSEDKTAGLYKLKPIDDCSFLKRRFINAEDGYVYAQLERASIDDMFNWRKKTTSDEEHLRQVAEAAVREMAAYDGVSFFEFLEKLRSLLRLHQVSDPTHGVSVERAYELARAWFRGFVPEWSFDFTGEIERSRLLPIAPLI